MWTLPFLYSPHGYPLAAFYQEWGAAVLGLCAMLLLAIPGGKLSADVPRIVLLPAGMLLLVLLQYFLGKGVYWGYSLLAALFLLWAAMLVTLGQRMRENLGFPRIAVVLAVFLLVGAELGALFGAAQHYSWRILSENLVLGRGSAGISGSMGQPNHYANYISLGLISLGLLRARARVPTWLTVLLAMPLLFVLVLSGSRSPWLYLPCMIALAWLWQRSDKLNRPLLHYGLLLFLGFGLMHLLVHLPGLSVQSGSITSVDRLIQQGPAGFGGGDSTRLHVWYEAWLIFTQHPLLGAGFGQFGWQHFLLGPELHNANFTGRWENAHNLVMQIAAEMGLAGLLVLIGTLALWLYQACRVQCTPEQWWGYGILAVLGIHSMLEYPLWYAYFMGIAAFLLGALDTSKYSLKLKDGVARMVWGGAALSGAVMLSLLLLDYHKLQEIDHAIRLSTKAGGEYSRAAGQQARDDLTALRMQTLLQPYIEGLLIKTGWNRPEEGLDMLQRRVRFMPENATVYLDAILLARAGRHAEAREQMERAICSFPADFPVALEKLRTLASLDGDAARYPALLEFSVKKYEERQKGR